MRKVKQLISFFLFVVVMFSSQLMYSQTTAAINGTIVDQNGSPLPSATIIAIHLPSGTQYGTTARADGKYNLVNLRVGGPYKVTVSMIGYTPQIEEGFNLELSQNLQINFKLPEQAVQLTGVTVTAERGAVLSQARTGAAQNVSLKQIEQIPTISRRFSDFAKLSPLFSGLNAQAAGRTSRFNNIQIDGAQYNDLFGLGSSGTPGGTAGTNPISLDAIQEFQVVIAPYDIRYGGFTGGGINAITRSGSNTFSGSAFLFGRNQNFIGQRNAITGEDKKVADFSNYQYGFRIGGPIVKDKLFFFVNGEMTTNTRPLYNTSLQVGFGNNTVADLQAKVDQFRNLLIAKGMTNPGSSDVFSSEQPSTKLLLRFDYNLGENHQLSLTNNYVDAYQDNLAGRGTSSMSFDSYNYRMNSVTNSTTLRLNSRFGNNISNELIVGYTTIRDHRTNTGALTPNVSVSELNRTFTMTAGFDQYSGANQLDQDIIEVTDNFSYYAGNHTITIGTHNEFFKFRNLFIRNFLGYYQYNSLADFQNDLVATYYHDYSRTPDPQPSAEFSVAQFGFYLQDEWAVLPQLKLTYGVRVDIPIFPDSPAKNDSVSKYLPGMSTDQVPSGNLLWSPRVGFNWDVSGDRTTQIRGGVGIFTGRPAYVWISNNYGNSGMLIAEVSAFGKTLPFRADPNNQYLPGQHASLGAPTVKSEIDLADPNLKMPQLLRYNLGVDQELPFGFVGTAEFLYSQSINDLLYKKLNLMAPTGKVAPLGSGNDGRPIYGGTNSYNNNFNDIMYLYNTSDGYQYNLVFQIQRNVARGFSVSTGYTYGRSYDRNSVTSSQAQSQMRYSAVDFDPNSPALTTSDWEIRNRFFASVTFTHEFFKNAPTAITLFYNGQTGSPFSFTARGTASNNLNNDGFDGNDLFYIPRNSSEILLGSISNNQFVPSTKAGTTFADLDAFIKNNSYLNDNRGKISERNGASAPWREYFDLHVAQDIPDLWGLGAFQLTLDVQNLLNLLNPEWGHVYDVANDTPTFISYQGRITYNGKANTAVYSFTKPKDNVVWSYSDLASRWSMQLGVRYSF
ncbi:MAG: carboxypeptidase regulatory-like domain-containing protein [Ignavibacteriales bacterium]|nr:carboxypeptidase regulatory-like domain-containing protein [Ignavibacteriales bacterium]